MPKHAITIPASRVGRRVRWMLEVSADVGKGVVHAKTSRKHTRAKRTKKASTPHASGMTARGTVLMAVIGTLVVGALVLAGYPSPRVVSVARNTQPEALAQPVHITAAVLPEARPAPLAAPVSVVAPARAPKAIVEKRKH